MLEVAGTEGSAKRPIELGGCSCTLGRIVIDKETDTAQPVNGPDSPFIGAQIANKRLIGPIKFSHNWRPGNRVDEEAVS